MESAGHSSRGTSAGFQFSEEREINRPMHGSRSSGWLYAGKGLWEMRSRQSDMSIVGDATLVFRVVHGLSEVRRSLAEHLLACAKA